MKSVIQIIEYKTGKVAKEIDVTDRSPGETRKIDDGINRNLNHNFYTKLTTL